MLGKSMFDANKNKESEMLVVVSRKWSQKEYPSPKDLTFAPTPLSICLLEDAKACSVRSN